jgi:uroporphyrinogen III methyltransferase / synthase
MGALQGLRVVVTRAAHQAEELAGPIRALGAEVILLPLIGIVPPGNPEALRHAATYSNEYDWIIFTSANAVHAFAAQLPERPQMKARIAAVGAATRETAEQLGFQVNVTPSKYVAESLIEALSGEDLINRKVLIPSAAVARDLVPDTLRKRGAQVEVVEAYRNVIPPEAAARAAAVFRDPYPDWIVFASSSAVENVVRLIGVERLRRTKIATIGPITSKTVLDRGLIVTAQAEVHTAQGLIDALSQAASMH